MFAMLAVVFSLGFSFLLFAVAFLVGVVEDGASVLRAGDNSPTQSKHKAQENYKS
jgi:hypothetical protein